MEPLTKEEATRLIKLTKQSLIDILSSPDPGANVEFDASHEDTGDLFTVKIYRGVAFRAKCKIFSHHLQKPILKTEKGRFKGL